MVSSRIREYIQQFLLLVIGAVLLLITWLILYLAVGIAMDGWLNPWHHVPISQRPPVDTWHSRIERLPGAMLPWNVALAVSVLLLVLRLVRSRNRAWVPLEFATLNLLFIVIYTVLAILATWLPSLWLPQPRPSPDVGYHRTWLAILITTILLLGLLAAQATGWLTKVQFKGVIGGVIIGTTSGAILFGILATAINWVRSERFLITSLAQYEEILMGLIGGVLAGTFIGALEGAIAKMFSRMFFRVISGAVLGALIGQALYGEPIWTLAGAFVGTFVGIVAGTKRRLKESE